MTHLESTLEALEKNPLFQEIFKNFYEAIFLVDTKSFQIITCNNAALTLFGADNKKKMLGMNPSDLQAKPMSAKEISNLLEEMERNSICGKEAVYKNFQGKEFLAHYEARPISTADYSFFVFRVSPIINRTDAENTLRTIISGTANITGKDFFDVVTRTISQVFDCKFVFIGKVIMETASVETLILKIDGETVPNFSYELKGTPCANVLNDTVCYYPSDVDFLFPEDLLLTQMGVKGYIGSAIYDEEGVPIGLLVALSDKAMQDVPNSNYIFSVFSARIGAEMQRISYHDKLVATNEDLLMSKEELQQQTEELQAVNDYLGKLNGELAEKNEKIAIQHQNITSSIEYAQNIQNAILPSLKDIKENFSDAFIFFKPKDIVSGDFYWFANTQTEQLLAVVDCTGHGVPGAFMSMLAYALLNQIVIQNKTSDPATVLYTLDKHIEKSLRQSHNGNRDGMDIAFCVVKKLENHFQILFAGAKRNAYTYENGNLTELEGTRHSIGGANEDKVFQNVETSCKKNAVLYLLSDGILDLFDKNGKRYGSNRFKSNIPKMANLGMEIQKTVIEQEIENSDKVSRDDITVIGIRL